MDAFYILQNSKSLMLRFRQQCKTAQAVAEMLQSHVKVLIRCFGADSRALMIQANHVLRFFVGCIFSTRKA